MLVNNEDVDRLRALCPRKSDRAFFVGQTGSGKTTLAQVLLRMFRVHVAVLDVKGTLNWGGYKLVRTMSALSRIDPTETTRIIYRPGYAELRDPEAIDPFFRWAFDRHHTTVYIDETAGVTQGNTYPYHYGACLMRGRELGVELWSATQRPMSIPQISMSEAEHVYAFRLRMPQDRDRVSALTAIPVERIATLAKRQFLYAPQDGDIRGPLTLEL
jgi:energy-coupling factor transporter ATP-binding protein EcfA2